MKHPRTLGAPEIEAFLTMLATERKVSTSTHNQALSVLLFLYREVLNTDLPWMDGINRPTAKRRIPSVLTKDEVAGLLAQMEGVTALLARLNFTHQAWGLGQVSGLWGMHMAQSPRRFYPANTPTLSQRASEQNKTAARDCWLVLPTCHPL